MAMYAVNADTMGISEYTGLASASLVSFNGRPLAITPTSVWELSGNDDGGTPIAWKIRTGSMRLNGRRQYNLFQLNPVLRAFSDVKVTLITESRGKTKTIGPFTIRIPARDKLRAWPKSLGEGHEPIAYQIEISGTGPAEMRGLSGWIRPIVNTWRSR